MELTTPSALGFLPLKADLEGFIASHIRQNARIPGPPAPRTQILRPYSSGFA